MNVLLVGCGAIGRAVAEGCGAIDHVTEVLLHDVDPDRVAGLSGLPKARPAGSLAEAMARADVVVEAASQAAVRAVGEDALNAGCDLVVVSVGALADEALRQRLAAAARQNDRRVYAPSGAIAGLDGVRSAREGGLREVVLETAKPPASLGLDAAEERRVLFDGPAEEAVKAYPKNVNVAAALALNGLGAHETRVRIVADPSLARNTHTVTARGAFGELTCRVANDPSPDNPATSYLAPLSVLALLRRLGEPLWVG